MCDPSLTGHTKSASKVPKDLTFEKVLQKVQHSWKRGVFFFFLNKLKLKLLFTLDELPKKAFFLLLLLLLGLNVWEIPSGKGLYLTV